MVKLSTGKEVEIKEPTVREAHNIKAAMHKLLVSVDWSGKLEDRKGALLFQSEFEERHSFDYAMIATGKAEGQLSEYTYEEIVQIANEYVNLCFISNTDKKK